MKTIREYHTQTVTKYQCDVCSSKYDQKIGAHLCEAQHTCSKQGHKPAFSYYYSEISNSLSITSKCGHCKEVFKKRNFYLEDVKTLKLLLEITP